MWRFFLVLLTAAVLCKETSAACGPVEEGQTTTLTCTVGSVDCASTPFAPVLRWDAASVPTSTPYVTQCGQSSCGGVYINNLPTTISGTSSTLTINSVSRTSPFNMETKWSCNGLCNGQTRTVCNKFVVYAKPENPSCEMREDTQSGDIKSVTVTCSTTKVYPRAKCSFERIKDQISPVTISQTPTYTHPPTAGTSAVYYMSECSVTVPVSNLVEGTHSFQGYIYSDVTGGRNLVDVTPAPGTVTLTLPQASHTCSPQTGGYFYGKSANCTCSLQSGYPRGRAQWYRGNQMVPGLSDGVLPLSFDSNNPEQVYTCKGVSDIGQGQESTVTAKFAFFDQTSVDVQPSTPSVNLCGNTSNSVIVTCRVSQENVYPAPTFSFSLDGLVFDTPQVGSLNNGYYQHLFSLSPDDGGVYTVTCRVTNTVSGETQEKETSIMYREPPANPPQITIKDETYQGTNPPNSVTLAAGYTGDVTCRVEGGYLSATITRLTCGSLEGSVTDNAATLTFQTDPLTKDMDGSVCTCTGQHVSGCYINKETTLTLNVTYAPVVTFTLDPDTSVVSEGATLTFTCSVNGNPPPSVSLVRQRTQEQLASGQNNSKTTELTHTMDPLSCLDTDVYVCTGQNSRGKIQKEINVAVNCSQQLNFNVDPVINGRLNGIAQLSLEIYGYPEPTVITLLRTTDNTDLTGSTRHAVSYSPSDPPFGFVDVTISDLAMEDFTNYTVTVDNGVEEAWVYGFYLQLSEEDPTTQFPVNDADKSDGDKDLIIIIMGVVAVVIIAALVVVIIILVRRFSSNKETRNANSKQTSAPTDMRDTRTDDDGYLEPGLATGQSNPLSLTDHNQYEEMPDSMSTFRQYNSLAGQNTDPPPFYNTLRSVSATPSASSTTTANGTYVAMVPHSTTTNGRNATYNNPMASASAIPLANVTDQTQNDNYINVDQPRTTENENGQLNDRKPYENVNVYASITDA